MVPLTPGYLVRDLAADPRAAEVVAARTGLGTINHTLLTIDAARAAGLVAGVAMTPWPDGPASIERSNRAAAERFGGVEASGLPPATPATLAAAGSACRSTSGSTRDEAGVYWTQRVISSSRPPGGSCSESNPSRRYSASASGFASLTSSWTRRQPRLGRARSPPPPSARPMPSPRASASTYYVLEPAVGASYHRP